MKLTPPQIQNLYAFTRQHYVEHYDLQTELVDHLANDIESVWQTETNLSFEDARDKAFKKFGVFGFMDVLERRQKAMNKRYFKYLWTELKQWFTFPKLITTMALFFGIYLGLSTIFARWFLIGLFVIICVFTINKSIQLKRQFKQRKALSSKKWMLEEIIFRQAGGSAMLLLSQLPQWYNFSDNIFDNPYIIFAVSIFSTLFCLWMYISFEVIPNKAEQLLNETYPEFYL
ncbi:hypothetical protein [Olleya namhaensis]|uniref:hypothetical protein n=1 Tax=Olleya namhaensis TaxID=1144750 RepID=UPI0024929E78|nr:hypothetical protein [Olleya namhaensis]